MNIRHRIAIFSTAALLLLSGNGSAFAHAQLRSATPTAGGTVLTAPAEVLVNFSEPLEPRSALLLSAIPSASASIRRTPASTQMTAPQFGFRCRH